MLTRPCPEKDKLYDSIRMSLYDGNFVMSSYNANIEVTHWLIALLPSYNLSLLLVQRVRLETLPARGWHTILRLRALQDQARATKQ